MYVIERILDFNSGLHPALALMSNIASPLFIRKDLLGYSHTICLHVVMTVFMLPLQTGVVAAETACPARLKIFTTHVFKGKVF